MELVEASPDQCLAVIARGVDLGDCRLGDELEVVGGRREAGPVRRRFRDARVPGLDAVVREQVLV
jgi:hypothetical protein